MPFIGQDWRDPGEQWIKTNKGSWERLKLLDNCPFLGFQSSDSSLDSDSSNSDNENNNSNSMFMDSELNQTATFNLERDELNEEVNDDDDDDDDDLNERDVTNDFKLNRNKILENNLFLINNVKSNFKIDKNDDQKSIKLIDKQTNNEYTIKEFNYKIKRTKNTSIQNIISQYEKQFDDDLKTQIIKTKSNKIILDRQNSFDELKLNLNQPFIKTDKRRNLLFPNKSIDQPINDIDNNQHSDKSTNNKFNFVKKNFEKLLNHRTFQTNANQLNDKKLIINNNEITNNKQQQQQQQKSIKHPTIKQCIRKIDLNTTHQNIIKHLEKDNVSLLNQEENNNSFNLINDRLNKSNELNQQLNNNSQPHFPIFLKITKEVAGYNSISDAFLRLDFYNAIRDIRRFNYVCKLLHLLITQNLTSLSGCATKFLFHLLEEIAFQVAGNQQNIHILHTLLRDVQKIMKKYYCWGRPIGSTILWETHLKTIEKICQIVKNIEIKPPPNNGKKGLSDLPAELIRTILLQLSDYKDLVNSGKVNEDMRSFLDEQYIWKSLCKYHFTNRQIKQFLSSNHGNKNLILEKPIDTRIKKSNADNLNWENIFHSLRKKFGLKEEYADCLFLCRHCRSLYWKQIGHPCLIAQMLDEMNKENNGEIISNNQNQLPSQQIRINDRQQSNRPINPLINNQIDLNRQINNLNRVNNQINNEIRQPPPQNNENRYVQVTLADSVPITPEAFLKFFSL